MNISTPFGTNIVDNRLQSTMGIDTWESEQLVYNEMLMMNQFFMSNDIKKVINPQERLKIEYYQQCLMNSGYEGEQIYYAGYYDRIRKFQIFTYEGRLYHSNGHPITSGVLSLDRGAMLIMDTRGNLFLTNKQRDKFHHSTFLAAGSLAYACMLEIEGGKIIQERRWSGHYTPESIHQKNFHDRLKKEFTKSYPQTLIPIFIKALEPKNKISEEYLSRWCKEPLIEAVQFPCGHRINRSELVISRINSTEIRCACNYRAVKEDDIQPDIETRRKAGQVYSKHLSSVRYYNSQLDAKIIELKLDDWGSRVSNISTISAEEGVFLFLDLNTSRQKVITIAKKLNLYTPDKYHKSIIWVTGRNKEDSSIRKELAAEYRELKGWEFLSDIFG